MKLSADQIEIVRKHVDQSTINIDSLRDDVSDHLCCVVEIKMERGNVFEHSLEEALSELAPEGLDEIQNETIFLLNSTKIMHMKKVMYLTGLITTMAISFGITFRILDWLGGNELIFYGMIGFVFLYMPLLMVNYFKLTINSVLTEKLRLILGFVSAATICSAITLKVLGVTGADLLLIVGTLLFSLGFLPFLFFSMYKKSVS